MDHINKKTSWDAPRPARIPQIAQPIASAKIRRALIVNDEMNGTMMSEILCEQKFEVRCLKGANEQEAMEAVDWLVASAKDGDALYFQWNAKISNGRELRRRLVDPLPELVKLTAVLSDDCRLDLPWRYNARTGWSSAEYNYLYPSLSPTPSRADVQLLISLDGGRIADAVLDVSSKRAHLLYPDFLEALRASLRPISTSFELFSSLRFELKSRLFSLTSAIVTPTFAQTVDHNHRDHLLALRSNSSSFSKKKKHNRFFPSFLSRSSSSKTTAPATAPATWTRGRHDFAYDRQHSNNISSKTLSGLLRFDDQKV